MNQFDQLDDFNLFSIFDALSLDELASMAELSPRYKELILEHYIIGKYQLHQNEIKIVFEKTDYLTVTGFAQNQSRIFPIIQMFGNTFTQLKIEIHSNGISRAENLSKYINQYCSNADQEINLYLDFNNDWTFKFNNAKKVGVYASIARSDIILENYFPQMEVLKTIYSIDRRVGYTYFPYSSISNF